MRLTSYAEYIATREPDFVARMTMQRSNPLGITVIIISSDGYVVTTRRSERAEQNPGLSYFVGGYIEPEDELDGIIFRNAVREVREEMGIDISQLCILGLASDPHFCHPEVFAVTQVGLRGVDIVESWMTAKDNAEASEVVLVSTRDLLRSDYLALFPNGTTWSLDTGIALLHACWNSMSERELVND